MLWLGLDYMNDVMDNSSQTDEDGNDSEQDERLTYRGIFQRLFIRPEIGALIGVVGLWVFFWAVTVPFGTAGGTASLVDFASTPLGIMAVAVSLLMVGGEFDLSAGAMTGAMGILVIMLSLEVGERGGAGLNLWFAIPIPAMAPATPISEMINDLIRDVDDEVSVWRANCISATAKSTKAMMMQMRMRKTTSRWDHWWSFRCHSLAKIRRQNS